MATNQQPKPFINQLAEGITYALGLEKPQPRVIKKVKKGKGVIIPKLQPIPTIKRGKNANKTSAAKDHKEVVKNYRRQKALNRQILRAIHKAEKAEAIRDARIMRELKAQKKSISVNRRLLSKQKRWTSFMLRKWAKKNEHALMRMTKAMREKLIREQRSLFHKQAQLKIKSKPAFRYHKPKPKPQVPVRLNHSILKKRNKKKVRHHSSFGRSSWINRLRAKRAAKHSLRRLKKYIRRKHRIALRHKRHTARRLRRIIRHRARVIKHKRKIAIRHRHRIARKHRRINRRKLRVAKHKRRATRKLRRITRHKARIAMRKHRKDIRQRRRAARKLRRISRRRTRAITRRNRKPVTHKMFRKRRIKHASKRAIRRLKHYSHNSTKHRTFKSSSRKPLGLKKLRKIKRHIRRTTRRKRTFNSLKQVFRYRRRHSLPKRRRRLFRHRK